MTLRTVKRVLKVNHLRMWQLAQACGVSRNSIYKYSHDDFKGHEKEIRQGLHELIYGGNKNAAE